jgi:hypothetical protein
MKVAARTPRPTRLKRGTGGPKPAPRQTQTRAESPKIPQPPPRDLVKKSSHADASPQAGEDPFQLTSILAQICLIQLIKHTEDQYGARNSGGHRPVQTGQGWRIFSSLFDPQNGIQSVRLFEHLLRFANDEAHVLARAFFMAYAPLSFEHDASGEYIGPGVWTPDAGSRSAAIRVRRTLKRWCEWLEALAHLRVHESRVRSSEVLRLDKTIIFLWPLHKRHNWTYEELLRVLRDFLGCGNAYPCGSETQLVSYCRGVLGLWKVSAPFVGNSRPLIPAHAVSQRLLKFLPAIQ